VNTASNNPAAEPANDFQVFARIAAWEKSEAEADGSKMGIGGIVSTEGLDRQSERVLADGLDFSEFLSYGWFNDNHGQSANDILGYPTSVKRVKPGDVLPNGETCRVHGWWAEGYLLNTKKGRECWENIHALHGTPRGIGFSIEGKVFSRKGNGIVARAGVRNVAITHVPVNAQTFALALAKALTAGSAIASGDIGTGAGDGGALRAESLDGGVQPPVDFGKDFGVEVVPDPTATVRKSVDHAPGLPVVHEHHLVEDWAEALAYGLENMGDPAQATLTKSEARIVARSDLHHLGGPALDRFLEGSLR
jgi:hypothetical protein